MLTRSQSRDAGSALMLVPAAVMVIVVLGAIAVDAAVVFLGQRALNDLTAAAANDAAAIAVDEPAFYAGAGACLAPATAHAIAEDKASRAPAPLEGVRVTAAVVGRRVEVAGVAEVRPIFARGLPGLGGPRRVQAASAATAAGGAVC